MRENKTIVGGCVGLHLVQVDIHGALLHLIAVPVQLALPTFDLGLHLGEGVLDLQQVRKSSACACSCCKRVRCACRLESRADTSIYWVVTSSACWLR